MKNLFDGGRLDMRQASGTMTASADGENPPKEKPVRRPQPKREPVVATSMVREVPVEAAPKKPEPPVTMEIVSGTNKREVKFQNSEGK
jgi:hypothetical protein